MRPGILGIAVAIGIWLAPAIGGERAWAQAPLAAEVRAKSLHGDHAEIGRLLGQRGLVRVIVELEGMDRRRTAWESSAPAVIGQKARTAALQRSVISRHFGAAASAAESAEAAEHAITLMSVSPMFAADVDRARLEALARDPEVARIHLDRLNKFNLNTSTRAIGMAGESGAWNFGGDGQTDNVPPAGIAILDSGVMVGHPFLRNRLSERDACFSTHSPRSKITSLCGQNGRTQGFGVGAADACPATIPNCDHGTHVAGIAAGIRPPLWRGGGPISGVARAARIQAYLVFSRSLKNPPDES